MIRGFVLACAFACAAPAFAQETPPPAPEAAQELCGYLESGAETSAFVPVSGFSLLTATPPLARPADIDVDGVMCVRSGLFIGPNDYHVLTDLGVPFFIRNADRIAILEMTAEGLRVRFMRGEPTPEEAQAMGAAIDRAHAELSARP